MAATSPIMTVMLRAVEKAARSLLRDFNEVEKLQISEKRPGNFVTHADLRSEKILKEELEKARPGYSFLCEESGEETGTDGEYRWIIDPLDGTHNFMGGIPQWNITVALEKDGELVAAIVYDPIRDELFRAEKGGGAFMNNQRLRVSGCKNLKEAAIGMGSPSFNNPKAQELWLNQLKIILPQAHNIRRFGCCALDLAYVAAGRFEFFWEQNIKPWDMAAGILLVREAGGIASDLSMGKNMLAKGEIMAGNQHIHPQMAKLLTQAAKL